MTTITPAADAQLPDEELHAPDDYDSWYSALVSFVFHFCVVMLVPLLASVLESPAALPPAIQVVQVIDSADATGQQDDDFAADQGAVLSEAERELDSLLENVDSPQVDAVASPDIPDVSISTEELLRDTARERATSARQAAAAAKARAAQQLNQNLGNGSGGGGTGGEGGGRAGRAARWILTFNTTTAPIYLAQLGGLQAEIAFPVAGGRYRFYSNLGSSPTSDIRDLSSENRIYWFSDDPQPIAMLTRHLGIEPTPIMIAFLPPALEEKMVRLELAYKNAASEDQIVQTVFECTARGGGYDVIVVDQILRR